MITGQDILALRSSLNWKQERLARYLGLDRSTVSRMENGQPLRGPVIRLLETLKQAAENGTADQLCPEIPEAAE